mmetsp:Transcript_2802/g.7161  ORF Transcript_2802/g.7161 Transcript_2802/m.7161 type:complete len:242 (-) Transcript_2802:1492-2217(-)
MRLKLRHCSQAAFGVLSCVWLTKLSKAFRYTKASLPSSWANSCRRCRTVTTSSTSLDSCFANAPDGMMNGSSGCEKAVAITMASVSQPRASPNRTIFAPVMPTGSRDENRPSTVAVELPFTSKRAPFTARFCSANATRLAGGGSIAVDSTVCASPSAGKSTRVLSTTSSRLHRIISGSSKGRRALKCISLRSLTQHPGRTLPARPDRCVADAWLAHRSLSTACCLTSSKSCPLIWHESMTQ